jgi:hybrid cluster-associated redox disulfide protein
MRAEKVSLDMTIDEMLARWPKLGTVLVRRRMACVGCAMAPFERLTDVAKNYGVPTARLLRDLRAALREARR